VGETSDSQSEKQLQRELLIAMAAEARAEREVREKILRWVYTAAGVFVALFLIAVLFF
jgi:hypothetical protein